jgi:hypothetical protein
MRFFYVNETIAIMHFFFPQYGAVAWGLQKPKTPRCHLQEIVIYTSSNLVIITFVTHALQWLG